MGSGVRKIRERSQQASVLAIAASFTAFAPCAAQAQGFGAIAAIQPQTSDEDAAAESGQQQDRRIIQFTVPLVYRQEVYGDVLVAVAPDNTASISSLDLRTQMERILNADGLASLDQVIAGRTFVTPESLAAAGIAIEFDSGLLQLTISSIAGEIRPVRPLFEVRERSVDRNFEVLAPSRFSAYLNINTNVDYETRTDDLLPEFFFDGATRFGDVAVEYDFAYLEQFGEGARIQRRGLRAVYDEPDNFRRFAAGDLRVETLALLRTPFIGGVSVEKNRRVFDPFQPAARLGAGQIFLDNRSEVEVVINDRVYETLSLEAGTYDLSTLPVQVGSNDVQLLIRDTGGREQRVNLDFFFQPLDLLPGDEQYSFAAGFIARELAFEPDYSGDLGFSGLYRKALSSDLILGGAVQLSEDVQLFGAQAQVVPQFIPGAFDVEMAMSFSELGGTGVAVRSSYRFFSGTSFTSQQALTLNVDYASSGFITISDLLPIDFDLLTLNASYNRSISSRGRITTGIIHSTRGGGFQDVTTAFVDYIHRFNNRLQLTAGVEYGSADGFSDNFGVRVGVNYLFGPNSRGSIDYRSRLETVRADFQRGADNTVGSLGYDFGITQEPGQTRVDASADYVANRFDTRVLLISEGDNFGSITDQQRVRVQVGTALAFAGGEFAVGHPIRDAFAIVHPHESLKEGQVIVGRDLSDNRYEANSGVLGGALQGRLTSYNEQSVDYDVDNAPLGYNVGDGVARVNPPYRGGYAIEVGDSYYVSVTGTLTRGGEPAVLATGQVTALDDDQFEPQPFFTNSVGRFGLLGFAPGRSYRVTLTDGTSFDFTVPDNDDALLRLTPDVPPAEE